MELVLEAVKTRIVAPEQRLTDAGGRGTQHSQIKSPKAKKKVLGTEEY